MAKKPVPHAKVEAESIPAVGYIVTINKANLTKQQVALLKVKLKELFQEETSHFSASAKVLVQPKIPPPPRGEYMK